MTSKNQLWVVVIDCMMDDEFNDIDRTELAELCGDEVLCARAT